MENRKPIVRRDWRKNDRADGSHQTRLPTDTSFFSFNRSGETGALLWHAWRQNSTLILATIGTGLVSWLLFNFEHTGHEAVIAFTFVGGSFAFLLTWVGALSIGADQHLRRIHFLAERGISPSKIWLSRVVVPFCGSSVLGPDSRIWSMVVKRRRSKWLSTPNSRTDSGGFLVRRDRSVAVVGPTGFEPSGHFVWSSANICISHWVLLFHRLNVYCAALACSGYASDPTVSHVVLHEVVVGSAIQHFVLCSPWPFLKCCGRDTSDPIRISASNRTPHV